jgi:F-type H+-transporting ATPase subunit b
MITPIIQFAADSSSGIGALGIDVKALIIQLATFLLAFLILQRFAFKPIAKIMDKRREVIEQGVTLGEKMKKESMALEAKVAEELRAARKQADAILADAQEASRDASRDAELKAKAKVDAMLADAKEATKRDVAHARRQLEKELVGLIADATEVIIDEKVDPTKDAALISRALQEQHV